MAVKTGEIITIKISPELKVKFMELADLKDMSLSALVRDTLSRMCVREGIT